MPTELGRLPIKFVTRNTDGFSNPARRFEILAHLWYLRADVAALTETHLLDEDIFFVLIEMIVPSRSK